jgi:hypothetical protein
MPNVAGMPHSSSYLARYRRYILDEELDIRSTDAHGTGAYQQLWSPSMPFEHESGRLRKAARRGTIFFTAHAEKERKKDSIEKLDVTNMLGRCSISLVETNKDNGEEEWRAEGTDTDGRKITAVVVLYEDVSEVKIITTWANK